MRNLGPTTMALLTLVISCSSSSSPTPDVSGLADQTRRDATRAGDRTVADRGTPADRDPPGPWKTTVVDGTPKFKSRVALAFDASGEPQLVYNIASSSDGWTKPDLWYAHGEAGGTFKKTRIVPADGISNEYPSLVRDSTGKLHIVYNRAVAAENQIDLFYVSSEDGGKTFSAPLNLTASPTADEYAAAIAVDGKGTLHILAQRRVGDPYSIAYLNVSQGKVSPVEVVADKTSTFSLNPGYSIAADAQGAVYAVYSMPAQNPLSAALTLRRRTGTTWSGEVPITDPATDAWGPATAVDGLGVLHLAYGSSKNWDTKTLTYNRYQQQKWVGEKAISTSTDDRSYYLGMAATADGTVHIAFYRFFPVGEDNRADIHYLRGRDGVFAAEERVTTTPALDEATPAIALSPNGAVAIAFTENLSKAPDGSVYLATR